MKNIVIVGGGTAGWITASVLLKGLPKSDYKITLIESPNIPTVGVGEATIPPIVNLINYLGLDERAFIKQIDGSFKYGIHFENWSEMGHSYMHAFGTLGTNYKNIPFSRLWLAFNEKNKSIPLANFSPCAVSAYTNRFSHPITPHSPKEGYFYPLSKLFYAYQFDAALLANYLKNYAIEHDISFISDTVNAVNNAKNGQIKSVSLTNNADIAGDYFIDCSGSKGLLIKENLQCEFESWKQYLPCDRAVVAQTKMQKKTFPYTKSIAMNAGWRWKIPLQNRHGNGYVYSSKYLSDDEATIEFSNSLENEELITQPRTIKFTTGMVKTPWYKNCIALGLSSSFFEPLESTSIHLTHKFAIVLKNALKYGEDMQQEANTFNNQFRRDALSIRDFLIAHYCTTQRDDTEFWRNRRQMEIPVSLRGYLNEFKATGFITLPPESLFPYESWLQVLIGQSYFPENITLPRVMHDAEWKEINLFMESLHDGIANEVSKLPSHEDYFKQ
jgi:tryptophan halogenase